MVRDCDSHCVTNFKIQAKLDNVCALFTLILLYTRHEPNYQKQTEENGSDEELMALESSS